MDAPKCEFIRINISQSDRIMFAIMNATTHVATTIPVQTIQPKTVFETMT